MLTVSAQQEYAVETLRAARLVKEKLGVRTLLGISNISYGLPNRDLLNHTFSTLALGSGIDMAIMNPNIPSMVDAVYAHNVIFDRDAGSSAYIGRFSGKENTVTATAKRLGTRGSGGCSGACGPERSERGSGPGNPVAP